MSKTNNGSNALFICLAFLLVGITSIPELTMACECSPTRTDPEEREGSVRKPPKHDFSWFSEADKKSDNSYCYERIVTNKHVRSNLDYDWPIAEMENKALPPGERDRICKVRGLYRDPASSGPLYYGRNNPQINTEVWKAKSEPQPDKLTRVLSYPPLETVLEFVFERYGHKFRSSLILRSFVGFFDTPKGRVFRYSYIFNNAGERSVLSWIPGLPEKVKADPRLAPLLRRTQLGPAFEVTGIVGVAFNNNHPPLLGTFPVYFFEPKEGQKIAKGSAEAYVPSK